VDDDIPFAETPEQSAFGFVMTSPRRSCRRRRNALKSRGGKGEGT
jgi:hypothetical protein